MPSMNVVELYEANRTRLFAAVWLWRLPSWGWLI